MTLIVDALTVHGTSTGAGAAHRRELSALCTGLQVSSLAIAQAPLQCAAQHLHMHSSGCARGPAKRRSSTTSNYVQVPLCNNNHLRSWEDVRP